MTPSASSIGTDVEPLGERFEDDGAQRTLAQLAEEQALNEAALFFIERLEQLADAVEKTVGRRAIDGPVIVRECDVHHRAHDDRVLTVGRPHYGSLHHLAHPDDADLGLIDDREAIQVALPTRVRDGERAGCGSVGDGAAG